MNSEKKASRRAVLRSAAVVPLAGCLLGGEESNAVAGIGEIILVNELDSSIFLTISVTQNNETVYEDDHELEADQRLSLDENWKKTATYEITATATVQDRTFRASGSPIEDAANGMIQCMKIEISSDGIDILQPLDDRPCERS